MKQEIEGLVVLYRDEHLIAVEKCSGELVHRGWARDGPVLLDRVRHALDLGGPLHPLHRLDRGTSGVIVVGLDAEVARLLSQSWEKGKVQKRYIALVRGGTVRSQLVDHAIPRRPGGPRVPAQTSIKWLASAQTAPRETSLVEAHPLTGRLHQVRRHLKHVNHPVIGDANYGKGPLNRALASEYGLERLALHALGLEFEHPLTGELVSIRAALPEDMARPLQRMGFDLEIVSR